MSEQTILIRSTNWIGDAVMSVAAVRELRRLFPSQRLALAARPWVADLFREQDLVDEVVTLDRNSGWKSFLNSPLETIDRAVLFPNSFRSALAVFLWGARRRYGYGRDARRILLTHAAKPRIKTLNRHQVYYYLDLLYQTGLSPVDYLNQPDYRPDISLTPTNSGLAAARRLLKEEGVEPEAPLVGLNPGAYYGSAKRWFIDRYAAVADVIQEELAQKVLLLGSEGEKNLAREISRQMRTRPVVLTGKTDVQALMGAISLCRLFLTNDSGPMHLASSLGVPLIAIFGSTDEVATGPLGPHSQVIHKHVACSPCLLRECPIDLRCFDRISVKEVAEAVSQRLRADVT